MPLFASSLGQLSRILKIELETKGYYGIYYTKDEETEINNVTFPESRNRAGAGLALRSCSPAA